MAKQFKRKSNGVSESNRKRGRQELRKVTRTAARKQQQDENHEDDLNVNNDSEEDNSGKEIDEEDEEGERDDNRGKAYSALLTLLKSEHKEKPKNVTSGSSSQVEKANASDSEDDGIAGANVEEEEEGEIDNNVDENEIVSESDVDDDDEDATNRLSTDPFELHFNLPSDDYLAKEEKLVLKDNEKWRTVDKQTYSDLAISSLVQLPPGEPLNPPLLKSSKLSEYTIKKRV